MNERTPGCSGEQTGGGRHGVALVLRPVDLDGVGELARLRQVLRLVNVHWVNAVHLRLRDSAGF